MASLVKRKRTLEKNQRKLVMKITLTRKMRKKRKSIPVKRKRNLKKILPSVDLTKMKTKPPGTRQPQSTSRRDERYAVPTLLSTSKRMRGKTQTRPRTTSNPNQTAYEPRNKAKPVNAPQNPNQAKRTQANEPAQDQPRRGATPRRRGRKEGRGQGRRQEPAPTPVNVTL